jgi:hypothetical protein
MSADIRDIGGASATQRTFEDEPPWPALFSSRARA